MPITSKKRVSLTRDSRKGECLAGSPMLQFLSKCKQKANRFVYQHTSPGEFNFLKLKTLNCG